MRGNTVEFGELLESAINGDTTATAAMMRQFVPNEDEKIYFADYFGAIGILISKTHKFAALSDRRVISLEVGTFGYVLYQDAYFEDLNSGLIYQPSVFSLYVIIALLVLFAIPTFGITLLILPFTSKLYYMFNKSGLVCVIKEGLSVYCFADRKRIRKANEMYRMLTQLRERRIQLLKERRIVDHGHADGMQHGTQFNQQSGVPNQATNPFAQVVAPLQNEVQTVSHSGSGPNNSGKPLILPGHDQLHAGSSDSEVETLVPEDFETADPSLGSASSAELMAEAHRHFDAGSFARCRKTLDQVRPVDRTVEYNSLYQRTVRVMKEISELKSLLNEKIREKSFAGREAILGRMVSLEPGNRRPAADLEALQARRESAREFLRKCGGNKLQEGSEMHTRLLWIYRSMDIEADRALTSQCQAALNIR